MAQTNVPLSTTIEQPTRRSLIGHLAAAGAVGATTALATTLVVDPHVRWELEADELYDRWMAAIDVDRTVEEEAREAYWDRWVWIIETQPQTMAGLAVQLRAIPWMIEIDAVMDEREEGILHRVASILDSIGGRA